jgi:hypothetical protein
LREGCAKRAEFAKRAAGTGAVSIRFRCDILLREIRPGRRIVIWQPFLVADPTYHYPGDDDRRIQWMPVAATITRADGSYTFVCTVDPGQAPAHGVVLDDQAPAERRSRRFRKTQRHIRIIRFLDEPDAPLCDAPYVLRDGRCDAHEGACRCYGDASDEHETGFKPLREPWLEPDEQPESAA